MSRGSSIAGLYAILDAEAVAFRKLDLLDTARVFRSVGVELLQYRDKTSAPDVLLRNAREIRGIFTGATLILNDHVDLVPACGFNGVHLGQTDLSPDVARDRLGPHALIGLSTHTVSQAVAAEKQGSIDYLAMGPIFATSTKRDPEPTVGLDVLRTVRQCTSKPLVAIGGITPENASEVLAAGASAIAVVSSLLTDPVEKTMTEFLARVRPATPQRSSVH